MCMCVHVCVCVHACACVCVCVLFKCMHDMFLQGCRENQSCAQMQKQEKLGQVSGFGDWQCIQYKYWFCVSGSLSSLPSLFFLSLHLTSHSPETLPSTFISIKIRSSGFVYLCLILVLQLIQMSEFIITVAVVTLLVLRLLLDFDARVSHKSKVRMVERRYRGKSCHVLGVLTCAPPITDVLLN